MLRSALLFFAAVAAPPSDGPFVITDASAPVLQVCNPIQPDDHMPPFQNGEPDDDNT